MAEYQDRVVRKKVFLVDLLKGVAVCECGVRCGMEGYGGGERSGADLPVRYMKWDGIEEVPVSRR